MFFPEHLLSKSGPLARVWLAANLEKKLSKNQVLQDKIVDDIGVIIRPEVAGGPMALRLSGQLLLGVVRIYSRKARYLLDDCNEALTRIKMAFRPGNIDMPANQSHIANPASLTLPDVLTEIDLLAPMPDPSLLFSQPLLDFGPGADDTTVPDWDHSQFLSGSIEQPRADEMALEEGDDLHLDLGEDLDPHTALYDDGPSIEAGRDAPPERRPSEEYASSEKGFEEPDLGLDFGNDMTDLPPAPMDEDMDVAMGGMTDLEAPIEPTLGDEPGLERGERESLSPLSSIRSSVERDLEQTFHEQNTSAFQLQEQEEAEDETEEVQQTQRAKRRRVLERDADTQITNSQIRDQQNNRDKILKPASFLPRDPMLLALMNMQKSGGFVSSILGDGRSQGWAPELRGILSFEVVSRPSQKRKRDSGVADLGNEEEEEDATAGAEKTPQLEFDQTDAGLEDVAVDLGGDTSLAHEEEMIQLPDDVGPVLQEEEQFDDEVFSPVPDNFDDTTAPLLHPADSGPISLGTKHAVHLLRERFGSEAESSESERQNTSVLFQDMLPEATTTKADATKMFFEVLVLATKDAIKVEQPVNELGGNLRIRSKRGLWGSWAETSASGELASETAPEASAEVAVEA
ncbi:Rec8 like protein-domain-containing protein [Massariosphaeria phaeospora]|uniref:Rec8 like protein-domain-containing protein n=1 Tax=Massariosphaeria phaeospora TaxID=100035 RepID=A0A7C8MH08_9PLEO|nr:Rec8 like protein-domain-containing protein [Massariosphaeria phaeospora]